MSSSNILPRLFLVTAIAVTGLISCAKKQDQSSTVGDARTHRDRDIEDPTVTGGAPASLPGTGYESNVWGEVIADPQYQDAFQEQVKALVSATIDPSSLGTVSCKSNDSTGVRFNGYIEARADGSINVDASQLRIVIWDSHAGKTDSEGNVIPEYPIAFTKAKAGKVSGNSVDIIFEDEFGSVRLIGTFDNAKFYGKFLFDNYKSYTGSTAAADLKKGTLGGFIVKTCGIFNCKH